MNRDVVGKQLVDIFDAGEKAGIKHAMFIGFGTLLGFAREKNLIEHDDDTDVCVRSDWITREQELRFYDELKAKNMFMYRARMAERKDTERYLWLSLRSQIKELGGAKSCIWFMFPWKGYLWHCKGGRWLKKIGQKLPVQRKLPNRGEDLGKYTTFMKGNSLKHFEPLVEVDFCGGKVNVPPGIGSILDEHYPDWAVPGRGSSARHKLVLIGKWEDDSTWMFINA